VVALVKLDIQELTVNSCNLALMDLMINLVSMVVLLMDLLELVLVLVRLVTLELIVRLLSLVLWDRIIKFVVMLERLLGLLGLVLVSALLDIVGQIVKLSLLARSVTTASPARTTEFPPAISEAALAFANPVSQETTAKLHPLAQQVQTTKSAKMEELQEDPVP